MSLVGLVLAERFVEDSKALERLREDLEALVGERTRQLASREVALARAEKLAGLGRLASGVAHEISSPLGAVTANLHYLAEGLRRGEVPGDAMAAAEESLASLERIARTVRHLYDAGRTSPRGAPSEATVDVADVADRAVAEASARAGRPVPVELDVEDGLAARGEERVVQEVLVSLLKNAVQALPAGAQGGRVVVRAARDGGRVRLEVADNGVGMCPETQKKAFDPFFSTWPQGPGTGLGLPVARGLVASLGGDIAIRSAPGQGTSVVMELPLAVAAEPGEGALRGSGI
jgi:signal transduction histidine kinase